MREIYRVNLLFQIDPLLSGKFSGLEISVVRKSHVLSKKELAKRENESIPSQNGLIYIWQFPNRLNNKKLNTTIDDCFKLSGLFSPNLFII